MAQVVASSIEISFNATYSHTHTTTIKQKLRCYHFRSRPQARSGEEKKYVLNRPKKEEVCGGKGRIGWAGKCQLPEQKRQVRHRKTTGCLGASNLGRQFAVASNFGNLQIASNFGN